MTRQSSFALVCVLSGIVLNFVGFPPYRHACFPRDVQRAVGHEQSCNINYCYYYYYVNPSSAGSYFGTKQAFDSPAAKEGDGEGGGIRVWSRNAGVLHEKKGVGVNKHIHSH